MELEEVISKLKIKLQKFPVNWDGKESILSMKKEGYSHWKQNEWIGFYFQFLCDKYLKDIPGIKIPGTRYGRAEFDGKLLIDWDFKAHPILNKNDKPSNELIANDMDATALSLQENGKIGLIVACGQATFDDEKMSFRAWHKELKGGDSAYSLDNIRRNAKKRVYKTSFLVKSINIYILDQKDVNNQGRFQKGMRNSNGKPRREKLSIDLTKITPKETIQFHSWKTFLMLLL